jgi:tetratricopeptide (TPR) repeat protein
VYSKLWFLVALTIGSSILSQNAAIAKQSAGSSQGASKSSVESAGADSAAAAVASAGGDKSSTKSDAEENATPYEAGSEAAKLYTIGTRAMEGNDFKKARETFRALAYKKPSEEMPALKVAIAAYKAGDLDDAIDWAKKAIVIAPKSAEAHLQLARLLEANQDWKAACVQYDVIYELRPDKQGKLNIEYPMLRALIRDQDYEKADKLSAEWTKEYKKNADSFFNRAWTLTQIPDQGNEEAVTQEAIKDYRQALKLDPKRHDARFNLAMLLGKAGQNAAAAEELEKFIQEAPQDPDADRAKSLLSKLRASKK